MNKPNDYQTVNSEAILRYIREYVKHINSELEAQGEKITAYNRKDLKRIAADLHNVAHTFITYSRGY
jgi:hypothetical protein